MHRGRPRRDKQLVAFATMRGWTGTHAKFTRAAGVLAHRGWSALGVERTDPVTLASVLDAAADKLLKEIDT